MGIDSDRNIARETGGNLAVLTTRGAGNGATEAPSNVGTFANVVTLGTIQANKTYELRILSQTDGDTVRGHYRTDGVDPDQNDTPITGTDPPHPIRVASGAAVKIIRDTRITNSWYAYLTPTDGGTIT
jgi:hypothetical protein